MKEENNKEKSYERNISIDRYRGILVFAMIFFQLLEHFKNLGIFSTISKHAPDSFIKDVDTIAKGFKGIFILPNLTLADLVAPAFLFAISLTLIPSYNRRCKKYGETKALFSLMIRYIIFIGIGIMMSSVNKLLDGNLMDGFFDIIDIPIFILTVIVLLLGIVYFILKKKEISKLIGKIIKVLVTSLGITGILITLINTILVVSGINETNLGYWLVLQHIGLSGFIALIIIGLSNKNTTTYRLVSGLIILALFTIFHETTLPTLSNYTTVLNNMNVIDNTADGGFLGAVAYSGLLLIYTAITDIYYRDKKKFRIISILLIIPAILVTLYAAKTFIPWDGSNNLLTAGLSKHLSINKGSISPSYLVIVLFISVFSFMIIDLFKDKKLKFDFFDIWGRNPFIMYILEFTLVGGITAALPDNLLTNANILLAIIEITLITSLLTFIAYKLYKKKSIIKI